jgi:hypothetical protein
MADTYGVTSDEIAKELPRLFSGGFTAGTKPDIDTVATYISDADAVVTLTLSQATGTFPSATDDTARLASRFIIDSVLGRIIRLVYTGNDPADVASAARPYEDSAASILSKLEALTPKASLRAIGWAGAPSGSTHNVVVW